MKLFAFIMAVLMLTLPVLPCADDDAALHDNAATGITKQQNQEEQEHNDVCSPFCHCSCCTGFSIHYVQIASASPLLYNGRAYTSYLQDDLIEHSSTIWQPPQLQA